MPLLASRTFCETLILILAMTETPSSNLNSGNRIYSILILTFLAFWTAGVIAAATGLACRSDRYEGAAKVRACNLAIATGFWARLTPDGQAKGSIFHLERGIALSQARRDNEAQEAFLLALRNAQGAPISRVPTLVETMDALDDQHTVDLWNDVLAGMP